MTASAWDERAEAYRVSAAHASGVDLDLLVEFCEPAAGKDALDVATGGGHVARRLREAGCRVTTCDPSPGMQPDVICWAEDLPFADASFDAVASRFAAHHFTDVRAAVAELARVSRGPVVVVDMNYADEAVERAELLRDPGHVKTYSEAEWREIFAAAGLTVADLRLVPRGYPLEDWLARTGCVGEEAQAVRRELSHVTDDEGVWHGDVVVIKGVRR